MKTFAGARRVAIAAWLLMTSCLIHDGVGVRAQSPLAGNPPARPRLVFTAAELPALQARIQGGGVPGWAFSQLSSGAALQTATSQASWQVYRSLRFMVEAAVRWKLTGNTWARTNAINALVRGWPNAISYLTPTGSNRVYIESTYVGAIAIAFDLLHDQLTPSERSAVVQELQAWVSAMYVGTAGPGGFSQYGGATDNHSFAWNSAIVMGLLAIWGEPGVDGNGVVSQVTAALAKLSDGYMDVVSPDGSYDENSGYATYGCSYSLRAHRAAQLCGFPDSVAGTNIDNMPSWYGRLLMGNAFHWTGDSSPSHRGVRFDPVLYWIAERNGDGDALWSLERVRAVQNIDINAPTWAFSAYLSMFLHYPETLSPESPTTLSGFFRDNKNVTMNSGPGWNKLNNHPEVGKGGSAWLHNSDDPSWNAFGLHYIIRDEWMSHSHEDDGHVDIVSGGGHLVLDRGYATPNSWAHAQSTDHNIVTVNGQGFAGGGTNYYTPPAPDGRFHGTLRGKLLSPGFDYVRGDHGFMWMMERADRSVILFKDPVHPFAIVLDDVRKSGGTHTYEQRWNTAGPMNGAGTDSNPVVVQAGGATIRGTWLEPQSVTVVAGQSSTNAGTTYYPNRVLATGTADTTLLGLWYPGTLAGTSALANPGSSTRGGNVTWDSTRIDKILTSTDQNPASDSESSVVGRFGWLRRHQSGAITAYAIGEGRRFDHLSTNLFDSSEDVTAIVKDGEIWVARAVGAPGNGMPFITAWAPGAINRVVVDGVDVSYQQSGSVVSIGVPPPPPAPLAPPQTKDRYYSFADDECLDLRTIGAITFEDGRIRGEQGFVTLLPAGGAAYPAQPLWIGFDLEPRGSSGLLGSLKLSAEDGHGDVITIDFYSAPTGGVYAFAHHPLVPPSVALIPNVSVSAAVRCAVVVRPTIGTLSFCDRLGRPAGVGTLPLCTQDISISFDLAPGHLMDNFGVFDAAEDGVDPQGAAVWVTREGRFGMAFQAPQILLASGSLSMGGSPLSAPAFSAWASQYAMDETLTLPYVGTSPSPLMLRELAFETTLPGAVPLTPGVPYVVNGATASGVTFCAGAWFQP